jgi:amino acid transporter
MGAPRGFFSVCTRDRTLAAVALIRLRRIEPGLPRLYSVWGYPWTPILFLVGGLAMTVNLWLDQPIGSSIGLVVILLGLPFYFHWRESEVALEPGIQPAAVPRVVPEK